jgi:hypothetical protein
VIKAKVAAKKNDAQTEKATETRMFCSMHTTPNQYLVHAQQLSWRYYEFASSEVMLKTLS